MSDMKEESPSNTTRAEERAYLVAGGLVRALSHRVRTPLSVIANDLSYYQTLLPPEDCARSLRQCNAISGLLSDATLLASGSLVREPIAVRRIVENLYGCSVRITDETARLNCDEEKLSRAFAVLLDLLTRHTPGDCEIRIVVNTSPASLTIELAAPAIIDERPECDSLAVFFGDDADSALAAPLLDALLWAHGCTITAGGHKHLRVAVRFARVAP